MLSERAATVLNVLVGEYLQSATPVASDEIARSLGQKISPATVRNTMAQLTDDGYISRPHVSSGGVPSDRGYRFYVESLPESPQLPAELRESVDRDLAQTEPDIGAWSKRCAAILSRLTENLAIVTAPRAQFPRLKRIQLVFLQESTALLVLVLEEARLLRKILPFGNRVDQVQLDLAASRLNDSLGGLNRSQMQSNRLELNSLEEQVKEGSVSLMREAETSNDLEHYTDGLRLLLSQPEFSQGEVTRQLVQLLEERVLLQRFSGDGETGRLHRGGKPGGVLEPLRRHPVSLRCAPRSQRDCLRYWPQTNGVCGCHRGSPASLRLHEPDGSRGSMDTR